MEIQLLPTWANITFFVCIAIILLTRINYSAMVDSVRNGFNVSDDWRILYTIISSVVLLGSAIAFIIMAPGTLEKSFALGATVVVLAVVIGLIGTTGLSSLSKDEKGASVSILMKMAVSFGICFIWVILFFIHIKIAVAWTAIAILVFVGGLLLYRKH